jgi:hypothetical protein
MAVAAPQSAMPTLVPTTRPAPNARMVAASRHQVLSYVPEPRVAGVVVRLMALMGATAFVIGATTAITVTLFTGLVTQLGH